jgi:hypothetical protein
LVGEEPSPLGDADPDIERLDEWQHARSQRRNAELGHDGRSDRVNTAANRRYDRGPLIIRHEIQGRTATGIINKVRGVNRVVYDITSKPPGTIEWE